MARIGTSDSLQVFERGQTTIPPVIKRGSGLNQQHLISCSRAPQISMILIAARARVYYLAARFDSQKELLLGKNAPQTRFCAK